MILKQLNRPDCYTLSNINTLIDLLLVIFLKKIQTLNFKHTNRCSEHSGVEHSTVQLYGDCCLFKSNEKESKYLNSPTRQLLKAESTLLLIQTNRRLSNRRLQSNDVEYK